MRGYHSGSDDSDEMSFPQDFSHTREDSGSHDERHLRLEELNSTYYSEMNPLLSAAELHLEGRKFANLERKMDSHVGKWRKLCVDFQDAHVKSNSDNKTLKARNDSLTDKCEQMNSLLENERKNSRTQSEEYERHQQLLESIISDLSHENSVMKRALQDHHSTLSFTPGPPDVTNVGKDPPDPSIEISRLKAEIESSMRESQHERIEYDNLRDALAVMRTQTNDLHRKALDDLELAKKKDHEILRLRFLVEDLSTERDYLESVIQEKYDPEFVSVTPIRQIDYAKEEGVLRKQMRAALPDNEFAPIEDGAIDYNESLDTFSDVEIDPDVKRQLESIMAVTNALSSGAIDLSQIRPSPSPAPPSVVSELAENDDAEAKSEKETRAVTPAPPGLIITPEQSSQWSYLKNKVGEIVQDLDKSKTSCGSIVSMLNQIERSSDQTFAELPANKKSTILSMVHLMSNYSDDIHDSTGEAMALYKSICQFVDGVFRQAPKAALTSAVYESGSDISDIEPETLDRQQHVRKREEYARIISGLEDEIRAARERCTFIENAMRTANSEVQKNASGVRMILSDLSEHVNDGVRVIDETFANSIEEVRMAGHLLMASDRAIEKAKVRADRLDKEKSELMFRYRDTTKRLQNEVSDSEYKFIDCKNDLSRERVIVKRRDEEIVRLEMEKESLEKELDGRRYELVLDDDATLSRIRQDLEENSDDVERLRETIMQTDESYRNLVKQLTTTQKEVDRVRDIAAQYGKELERVRMDKGMELNNLESEIARTKQMGIQERQALSNEYDELMERLQDELSIYKERALSGSPFDLQEAMEQMEDALHEAYDEIQDKEETINSLAMQVKEASSLAAKYKDRQSVSSEKEDVDIHVDTTDVENDAESYVSQCRTLVELLEVQLEENPPNIHDISLSLSTLNRQLDTIRGILERKDRDLTVLQNRILVGNDSLRMTHQRLADMEADHAVPMRRQRSADSAGVHTLVSVSEENILEDVDDSPMAKRRSSLLEIREILHSQVELPANVHPLMKESRARSRESQARVSIVSDGRIPLLQQLDSGKSFGARLSMASRQTGMSGLDEKMSDRLGVKETPANSPKHNSPRSSIRGRLIDDEKDLDLPIVDDASLFADGVKPRRARDSFGKQVDSEELQREISEKESTINSLKQKLNDMSSRSRHDYAVADEKLRNMRNQYEKWQDEMRAKMEGISRENAVNEGYREKYWKVSREKAELGRKLDEMDGSVKSLQMVIEEQRGEIVHLRERMEEVVAAKIAIEEDEVDDIVRDVNNLHEDEILRFENELKQKVAQLEAVYSEQIVEFKRLLHENPYDEEYVTNLEQKHEDAMAEREDTVKELSERCVALQSDCVSAENEIEKLRQSLNEYEGERVRWEQEKLGFRQQHHSDELVINECRAREADQLVKFEELQDQCRTAEAEVLNCERKMAGMEEEMDGYKARIAKLMKKCKDVHDEAHGWRKEIRRLKESGKKDKKKMKKELKRMSEQNENLLIIQRQIHQQRLSYRRAQVEWEEERRILREKAEHLEFVVQSLRQTKLEVITRTTEEIEHLRDVIRVHVPVQGEREPPPPSITESFMAMFS